MSKRKYRRFTAEEKLAILKEAEQPGVTTAEVCRKHSISPSLLYSWRAVAQDGAGSALKRTDSRGHAKPDAEVANRDWASCRGDGHARTVELEPGGCSGGARLWRSVYFAWRARAKHDRLEDLAPVAPRLDAVLPEEERAMRIPLNLGSCSGVIRAGVPAHLGA